MRFSCRSHSSQALLGSQATASKKKQTRVMQPVEGKKRSSARLQAREQKVEEAMKRAIRKATAVPPPEWNINFVYVGNLLPGTTEFALKSAFRQFGEVEKVIVRCSQGQYVTGVAVPKAALTRRDRHYASVHFAKPESARLALSANGKNFNHRRIVVTISVADLPEVKDIAEQRLAALLRKQEQPSPPKASRALQRTDTEIFIDYREPASDRNRLLGVSFGKAIA